MSEYAEFEKVDEYILNTQAMIYALPAHGDIGKLIADHMQPLLDNYKKMYKGFKRMHELYCELEDKYSALVE